MGQTANPILITLIMRQIDARYGEILEAQGELFNIRLRAEIRRVFYAKLHRWLVDDKRFDPSDRLDFISAALLPPFGESVTVKLNVHRRERPAIGATLVLVSHDVKLLEQIQLLETAKSYL